MVSFYHAIHAERLVQIPSKKEDVVSVFICNGKAEEAGKNGLARNWAENLTESDKGSYFDQKQWLKELCTCHWKPPPPTPSLRGDVGHTWGFASASKTYQPPGVGE